MKGCRRETTNQPRRKSGREAILISSVPLVQGPYHTLHHTKPVIMWLRSLLLVLLAVILQQCRADPFRLPGSPYPAPSAGPNCSKELLGFDDTKLTTTQLLTLQTLQGNTARSCPTLFRIGSGDDKDMQWRFAQLLAPYGVTVNVSLRGSFTDLLRAHLTSIQGYFWRPFISFRFFLILKTIYLHVCIFINVHVCFFT